ncbi:MAG: RdgB/HAM1 family non-canonical purine NTP pyrophosphatase [Planctomycetota bacterium]
MSQFTLVVGTRNKKKRKELEYLLEKHRQITLKTLDDYPDSIEVEETGTTFRENAELKATQQAKLLGQWVLGEDSGLSVKALDGAPGVYSARFAGEDATDEDNNALLLRKLEGVSSVDRVAWYTSHMALSDPEGNVLINCEGRCYGRILPEQRGSSGFGYDPMFLLPEYHLTFGQMGDAVKSVLSHRARANRQFVPKLLSILSSIAASQ